MSKEFTSTGTLVFQCTLCGEEHPYIHGAGVNLCPDRDKFITVSGANEKLASYLKQENEVLHKKVQALEAKLADRLSARILKGDDQGRVTVIAVDDKAYIAAWKVNGDLSSEREACAKVAEDYGIARYLYEAEGNGGKQDAKTAAEAIASLIRGRGER